MRHCQRWVRERLELRRNGSPRDGQIPAAAVTQVEEELSKPGDSVPYQGKKECQREILKINEILEKAKKQHGRSVCWQDEQGALADLGRKNETVDCKTPGFILF